MNYHIFFKAFFYQLTFFFCLFACDNENRKEITVLKGNINNLPDGKLFALDKVLNIIDSTVSKDGVFNFNMPPSKFDEPMYAQILHVSDRDSIKRRFLFETVKKINGYPLWTTLIMLEENGSDLKGIMTEYNDSYKSKTIRIVGNSKFGKQSQVLYGDTLETLNGIKISVLKKKIEYQPYSYHLLYKLKDMIHSLSNEQALSLLDEFDDNVKNGKQANEFTTYIKNRNAVKLDYLTTFLDVNNMPRSALKKGAKVNILVLWASWCGPCRMEIPQLKKIYKQYSQHSKFNMVSVSLDEDLILWKKALDKENMPWSQLVITSDGKTYSKELFSYDGKIPTTLFYDDQGILIKKFVGYNGDTETEFRKLIVSMLNE